MVLGCFWAAQEVFWTILEKMRNKCETHVFLAWGTAEKVRGQKGGVITKVWMITSAIHVACCIGFRIRR